MKLSTTGNTGNADNIGFLLELLWLKFNQTPSRRHIDSSWSSSTDESQRILVGCVPLKQSCVEDGIDKVSIAECYALQ